MDWQFRLSPNSMSPTTPSPYLIRRNGEFRPGDAPQSIPVFFDQQEQRLDFWSYWCTIRNHIGLVAGLVAVVVFATLIWVSTAVRNYTASTVLLIENRPPPVFTPKEGNTTEDPGRTPEEFFDTQVEILRSRSLALDVIRKLDLAENAFFTDEAPEQPDSVRKTSSQSWTWLGRSALAERLTSSLASMFRFLGHKETPAKAAPESVDGTGAEEERLVNAYFGGLRIDPLENTNLVQISFTSPSPTLAAKIANEHARAYVVQGIRIRSQANVQAEQFLQRKLVELKAKLEESETVLNEYRRAHGIIPGLMSVDGKEAVVIDRLADLSKDLTAAQVARIGLEAQVETIRRQDYDSLPAVVQSEQIRTLKTHLSQLISEYAGMENEFTKDYSPLAALGARVEEVKRDLQREIENVIASIRTAYQGAVE